MGKYNGEDYIVEEQNCSDSWSSWKSSINGSCHSCGMPTVNGEAAYGCQWSTETCSVCKYRPCNGSC